MARPLPTLGECIDGMFPKSGSSSSAAEQENKGDGMATKAEKLAYYRAEAIARPFADAAERSSTVSKTGEGQSGMRTERITLDVTHGESFGVSHWSWVTILRLQSGESVRVVEEPLSDAWAQRLNRLTAERDAAIRERDALRAERITQSLTADRFASAVREADTLRARVDELQSRTSTPGEGSCDAQAASGGGKAQSVRAGTSGALEGDSGQGSRFGSGEPVAWGVVVHRETEVFCCPFAVKQAADHFVALNSVNETMSVVPLYSAPPQPRGWLTGEERDLIAGIADDDEYTEHGQNIAKGLLARSSPPEVVLPEPPFARSNVAYSDWMMCLKAVKESLAASGLAVKLPPAGVAVKEVGSE
jgi:hypothetical protein